MKRCQLPRLDITVPGKAATGRPRINKGGRGMHNTKNVKAWVRDVKNATVGQVPNQIPAEVPVRVDINVYLPWPKATKKVLAATNGAHTQKPDMDNLIKPILDALSQAGVWADDNQIDTLMGQKWRCPVGQERTEITVTW